MSNSEIRSAIRAGLESLDIHSREEWKAFTRAFKTRLCEIGKERDYQVAASSVEKVDYGEWLYDVTWLDYDSEYLRNVPLVAEVEWGNPSRIGDDFEKLLVARADLKLMIFAGPPPGTEAIFDRMVRQIEAFRYPPERDDTWLIGAVEWDGEIERGWRLRWFTTT